MIITNRLQLTPCNLDYLDAFLRDRDELARMLGVSIPNTFPVFPGSFAYWYEQLSKDASLLVWSSWLFVHRTERVLIGDGGFKGPPTAQGTVEIGYAIVPEFRGRGLATEAAYGLIDWAFSHPHITAVRAETLTDGDESMGVLKKVGMIQVGMGHDPDEGDTVQWAVQREQYVSAANRQ